MSLVPKEHGAYGQMAVPLVTALAVAGPTPAAALTVMAVVMSFLAHEPLLVLMGHRGARVRRDTGAAARRWLIVTGIVAAGTGLLAVWLSAAAWRWTFLLPLAPAMALVPAVLRGREKSGWAEVSVSLAFSLAAVPTCVAAGASPLAGLAVALPFAVVFVAATLAVRGIVLGVRGGGDPRAQARARAATLIVVVAGTGALVAGAGAALLPWTSVAATLPGAILAAGLALVPPPARQLRAVGWTLVAISLTTAAVLVIG